MRLRSFLLPLLAGVFVLGLWAILAGGIRTCTTGPLERGGGVCSYSQGLLSYVASGGTVEFVGAVFLWLAAAVVTVGELLAVVAFLLERQRAKREAKGSPSHLAMSTDERLAPEVVEPLVPTKRRHTSTRKDTAPS